MDNLKQKIMKTATATTSRKSTKGISEYLVNNFHFTKIWEGKRRKQDGIDIDKLSCYKRISEVTYLFYSERMKHFDIAYKYEKPKGMAGGGFKSYSKVTIPRPIYTANDADMLMLGITGDYPTRVTKNRKS